jgi:ABC-type nitrate/sulfonate/bicarbonate transport system ATPase subunit
MSANIIKIGPLTKVYSDGFGKNINLFENLSFDVEQKKVTVIAGGKGLGKSVLLQSISFASAGKKRPLIPTLPSSLPWLNVTENIEFNVKERNKTEISEIINFVGLEGYNDHFPNNKSIGFRFRISLARAIVNNPELILIDDSLSALSTKRRIKLFSLLRKLASDKEIPIIYTTSSVSDAVRLADKVILLSGSPAGIISQKNIFINEDLRSDVNSYFNLTDYFSEDEIKSFAF